MNALERAEFEAEFTYLKEALAILGHKDIHLTMTKVAGEDYISLERPNAEQELFAYADYCKDYILNELGIDVDEA